MDQVTDLGNTGPEILDQVSGMENDVLENAGPRDQGWKMYDWKKRALLKSEITGLEMAGRVQLIRITDSNNL